MVFDVGKIRTKCNNNFLLFGWDGFVGVQIVAHRYKIGQKYISEPIFTNFYVRVFHQIYLLDLAELVPTSGIAFAALFATHFPVFLGTGSAKFEYIIAISSIHIINNIH